MPKLLAIDYGSKRTGLAETDDLQIIASALTAVDTKDLYEFIKKYVASNNVETIVVGEMNNYDGSDTHNTKPSNEFARSLEKKYPNIKIEREDESFTSRESMQAMIQAGVPKMKRRDKKLVDKISATIILQRYMERIQR
ncbi:MAG: Holliday junction resolvase RuvX [Flavobacteriales bacterium]